MGLSESTPEEQQQQQQQQQKQQNQSQSNQNQANVIMSSERGSDGRYTVIKQGLKI